ncbi:MAG TPA: serine/threonine-protein kinase [Burkholderiaceae bacterium]|nr:serine/threonine-protein kinase [Burkholderiaceae bacterium]
MTQRRNAVATARAPDPTAVGGLQNYRIERSLGRGAMAQVFLALDLRNRRWVALKVLELGGNPATPEWHDALERFRREATVLHGLQHPGIVAVLDAGPSEGGAWMAMEAVAGCDLTRYTRPARLLPPPLVARIGARLAEALAYAHRRGVVHRDVKPANVLVDWTKDVVKLSDFGLARSTEHTQTRSGITLGSPDYMAPEQLAGGAIGPASDVYGLGATLFELLAGRRPHQADNLGELLRAVASEPAPQLAELRPELDSALCGAVMPLLAKDLTRRPNDAARVAAQLWNVANSTAGGPATP